MTVVDLMAAPTVLIAEADPWTRDLLKQVVLTVRCDAQLDVCGDGQQALAQLGRKTYGLVIADRELPGVGGLDLLRTVRQRRAVAAQPFILLSARNDSASVREALPLAVLEAAQQAAPQHTTIRTWPCPSSAPARSRHWRCRA